MNIKEMWEKREWFDTEIEDMKNKIEERWRILTGLTADKPMYVWSVEQDLVFIEYYPDYYYEDADLITTGYPIRFFEIEDEVEAVNLYADYLVDEKRKVKNEAQRKQRQQNKESEQGEKKLYLDLKEKYGE